MDRGRLVLLAVVGFITLDAQAASAQGLVVDHRHVALFERIPETYLTAARDLRMLFSDRSVGQNINEAIDCLTAAAWVQAPASCRRDYYDADWSWKTYTQADRDAGLVPARILFDPDPVRYSRANWTFEFRSGSWSELTRDFIESLAPAYVASKDVLSYQFSYLNVDEASDIADLQHGFFADTPDRYDVYDLEQFIAQYPDKVFVFWTTSLARAIGTQAAATFNEQMRAYCHAHGKVLFDAADLLASTPDGPPCYDNRDGVPYQSATGASENHPDDGHDYPAICQDYTTEVDGGHLGSVSAGKVRIAKAMWVLMACIAGWEPTLGDFDADGDTDLVDFIHFQACFNGPNRPPATTTCADADNDTDNDVDLDDFVRFQTCFNGPNRPPKCE